MDDLGYYVADWIDDDQLNDLIDQQLEDDVVFLSIYADDEAE